MKLMDLTYLKKVANNDKETILEMVEIFEEQCSEFIAEFKKHIDNEDYIELSQLAHKVKSSVAIMGMNNFANELKTFENETKENKNVFAYKDTVNSFIELFNKTLLEIETLKTKLKS